MTKVENPIIFDTNILVKMRECPKEIVDKIFEMDIFILREVFTEFKEMDSKVHIGLNNIVQEIKNIDKLLTNSNINEVDLSNVNKEVKL